jgi:hypothetical protein
MYKIALTLLFSALAFPQSQAWTTFSFVSNHRSATATSLKSNPGVINNNIVLRPSDDPNAFDNFKIGSARVHRYVRDSEEETTYILWYHGRSKELDSDRSLPPLSTGRIGRATSRNGLIWDKVKEGSQSEDAEDVSLGLNTESWWGFDTSHVGLGQVLLPMSTPAVMAEGGVYLMYFFGGSHEDTPLTDYIENVPESARNAKIKGMRMKIGVAISQDGISWGRVEGDDPSGACVAPYDKADPNQSIDMRDDDDLLLDLDEELYCGWPEVAVKLDEEEIVKGKKKPRFFMYYSTMRKSDRQKCIAVAVSTDGFRWMKRGICLEPDATGPDAGGCARCNVLRKATYELSTKVWRETDGWVMLYEGVSKADSKHRIMLAESDDGRQWKKRGVVFDVGTSSLSDEAWDCAGVGSPHVIRLDDGSMRMYYTGQGVDGSTAIGVAKVTEGGAFDHWTREQAEFSFA